MSSIMSKEQANKMINILQQINNKLEANTVVVSLDKNSDFKSICDQSIRDVVHINIGRGR